MPMWTFLFACFLGKFQAWQASRIAQSPSSLPLFPSTFRKWGEGGSNSIPFPLSSSSPPSFCFLLAQRARATRAGGRDGERAAMPCHARAARSAQCTTTTTVLFSLLTAAGREGDRGRGAPLSIRLARHHKFHLFLPLPLPPPRFCLFHGFCFPSPTCYCFVSKRRVGRRGGDTGCLQTPKIPLLSTRSPLYFLFMRSISQSTSKLS